MAHANVLQRREMTPCSPPRRVSQVYSPDQLRRILGAVRRGGPVQQMLGRYPQAAKGAVIDPVFRGELALETICYDPDVEDVFFNSKLMRWAREHRTAQYCVPRQLAFNFTVPSASHDTAHVDGPAFRGLWHVNTPPWLLFVMGFSGLFADYATKMVQITCWYWRGPHGGFTYWPDGAWGPPQHLAAPIWNEGLIAENQYMFHRAESSLPPGEDHAIPQLSPSSTIEADPADPDGRLIRTGGEVVARVRTAGLRLMVHWSCELFGDMAEVRRHFAGADKLTHALVFDRLEEDLRRSGVEFAMPADPLNDPEFKSLLERHYRLGPPTAYPRAAPLPTL
jgi:hypothetical protein